MQFCFSFNYYDSKTTAIQNDASAVADLGEGAQGAWATPLFLDQTEAQRAEKSFWRPFFFQSDRPTQYQEMHPMLKEKKGEGPIEFPRFLITSGFVTQSAAVRCSGSHSRPKCFHRL